MFLITNGCAKNHTTESQAGNVLATKKTKIMLGCICLRTTEGRGKDLSSPLSTGEVHLCIGSQAGFPNAEG